MLQKKGVATAAAKKKERDKIRSTAAALGEKKGNLTLAFLQKRRTRRSEEKAREKLYVVAD